MAFTSHGLILLVTMNLKKVSPTFPVISKCHKITWQITIEMFLDLSLWARYHERPTIACQPWVCFLILWWFFILISSQSCYHHFTTLLHRSYKALRYSYHDMCCSGLPCPHPRVAQGWSSDFYQHNIIDGRRSKWRACYFSIWSRWSRRLHMFL